MKAFLYSLLGFLFFLVVLTVSLVWKIQQQPVHLEGIKPRLEKALSHPEAGYQVSIGSLSLTWRDLERSALFELKDIVIHQKDKEDIDIQNALLSLSMPQLILGRLRPNHIIIEDLEFDISSVLSLYEKTDEMFDHNNPQDITNNLELSHSSEALDWLNFQSVVSLSRLEVRRLLLIDSRKEVKENQYLAMANVDMRRQAEGIQGNVVIDLPGEVSNKAFIRTELLLRKNEKDITGFVQWKNIDFVKFKKHIPHDLAFPLEQIITQGTGKFVLNQNLQLHAGQIDIETQYEDSVIKVSAKTDRNQEIVNYPVQISIDTITPESLRSMLPEDVGKTNLGTWLFYKISKGVFKNVIIETVLSEGPNRALSAFGTKASFQVEGTAVKYSSTLMPVTDIIGEGLYENDILTIKAEQGLIGDIQGKNIKLEIVNLSVKGAGVADISLQASGPFKTALQYIADEPIAIDKQLGFSPDDVKGNIDFNLQLNFPTLKDLPKEDVTVKIDGVLTRASVPDIVRGLTLSSGPYNLKYSDGTISLKGKGKLSNRDIEVDWIQYLNPEGKDFEMKVEAKIISDKELRTAFDVDLEEYISGDLPIEVEFVDYGEKSIVHVTGDITPTVIHIDPLAYNKASGVDGVVLLKAHLQGDNLKEISDFSVKTRKLSFNDGRIIFRQLSDGSDDISQGTIPLVTLGQSKVSVDFESPHSELVKAVLKGDVLDLQPWLHKKTKKTKTEDISKSLNVSIQVKEMLGDRGEKISNPQLYFETDNIGAMHRIEMDASIGDGEFYLRFKPDETTGKRSFILETTDAGHTLRTFGLYNKMRGGTFKIIGHPYTADKMGDLSGKAIIEDFKLKSAPILAKLLGAMSVQGMDDLLKNDGIAFKRLESDFEWRFRNDGDLLILKEGKTSGSSLGLTFDGVLDQDKDTLDLSGTIIPVSGVNNFIGGIPVIGDILTGGDALIAASYTASGLSSDPKVVINPLSVLTPGFLRKLFFEKSPETKEKELLQKRHEEKLDAMSNAVNDNSTDQDIGTTNTNLKTKKEAE